MIYDLRWENGSARKCFLMIFIEEEVSSNRWENGSARKCFLIIFIEEEVSSNLRSEMEILSRNAWSEESFLFLEEVSN